MPTVPWERGVKRVFHALALLIVLPGLLSIAAGAASGNGDVLAYAAFMVALYAVPALVLLYAILFLVLWIGRGFGASRSSPPPYP